VELQEDVEALSSSKRELLDAERSLKAENVRLNALIKETIESYKQKIETLKEEVRVSNEKAMHACFNDAKSAVETCYQESNELKRRVEDLTEKLASVQNALQTREEERDVATESLELTMRELEAKTSEIEQLEESLQSAKNTTNQISAQQV
jgi:chromosome segregation ATPase